MEIVFWIAGAAALVTTLAYAAIFTCMMLAKYRMTHLPRVAERTPARSTKELRYRTL